MICGNCGKEFRRKPLEKATWYCDDCNAILFKTKKKPMSNADRIRAMSDNELAEYIVNHRYFGLNSECLDWLRQPADMSGEDV